MVPRMLLASLTSAVDTLFVKAPQGNSAEDQLLVHHATRVPRTKFRSIGNRLRGLAKRPFRRGFRRRPLLERL
jgi:hypothetical protein